MPIHPGEEGYPELAGQELSFRYPGLMDDRINFVSGFLQRLLSQSGLSYQAELVLTILREIVTNCCKAHAKRIHFQGRGLSMLDPEGYRQGMSDFQSQVLARWREFVQSHQDSEFYIEIRYAVLPEHVRIRVVNNIDIVPGEWDRIRRRLDTAAAFRDMFEAFRAFEDSTEGAGLGLVFISLLLKNAGIAQSNLHISSSEGKTTHTLMIPRVPPNRRREVMEEIVGEIEGLPSLPQRIDDLVRLCHDSSASIAHIAKEVSRDPALVAHLLRVVNSPAFRTHRRNPDLETALTVLGLEETGNIAAAVATRSLLADRYQIASLEEIWEESNLISHFAGQLARRLKVDEASASIAGLLSEIGRVVLTALHGASLAKISSLLGRVRTSSVLEESVIGISHPEIGALLGEKWKFPAGVIEAIRLQHRPLAAGRDFEDLVVVVYLASRMGGFVKGTVQFFDVEPDVLQRFELKSPEDFAGLASRLNEGYGAQG